jgi:hypothetical protein
MLIRLKLDNLAMLTSSADIYEVKLFCPRLISF